MLEPVNTTGGGRGDGGLWKQLTPSRPPIQCFRCGGPQKLAECKEKPKNQEQSNAVTETSGMRHVRKALMTLQVETPDTMWSEKTQNRG